MVYLPKKTAFILMLVLGGICLPDGIVKRNPTEILVALGTLTYAIVSLVNLRKEKQKAKNKVG